MNKIMPQELSLHYFLKRGRDKKQHTSHHSYICESNTVQLLYLKRTDRPPWGRGSDLQEERVEKWLGGWECAMTIITSPDLIPMEPPRNFLGTLNYSFSKTVYSGWIAWQLHFWILLSNSCLVHFRLLMGCWAGQVLTPPPNLWESGSRLGDTLLSVRWGQIGYIRWWSLELV